MNDNPLAMKLSHFMDLTPAELPEIEGWSVNQKRTSARAIWTREGDGLDETCILLSGWGCRYKETIGGKRQIVGLMLPGDMWDLHGLMYRPADHSIVMLSDARVAVVPNDALRDSLERQPRLTFALWWSTLVDEGIAREWIVNVGQRDAAARVANLMCELWTRCNQEGRASLAALSIPLTQVELGEALGLTTVHINRTLKALKERELLTFKNKQAIINDINKLMRFAGFDPTYLQLRRL